MTTISLRRPFARSRSNESSEEPMSASALQELQPSPLAFALSDAALWFIGLWIAAGLRLESPALSGGLFISEHGIPILGLLVCAGLSVLVSVSLARAVHLYQGRHLVGSFEEMLPLAIVVGGVTVAVTAANALLGERMVPLTAPAIAAPVVLVLAAATRALARIHAAHRLLTARSQSTTRALVVGAGSVGRALADSMRRDPSSEWEPVAFLDDDPRKRHLRHGGVPVIGGTSDLAAAVERSDAEVLVIATPAISAGTIGALTLEARALDLPIRIVPPLKEMMGAVRHTDLRRIEPQDLLGRRQVATDLSTISQMIAGKVVLVTGAGGSIGSELCRQINGFGPRELVMLDRDESALHALLLSMDGIADLGRENMELADIRDADRLDDVFAKHAPDVVFHAAALKHVNMLERAPGEAYKTNVMGTHNVLEAAERHGVEQFVNISTDKAADPHNVLGLSKRVAEGLTAQKALTSGHGSWVSVRFGNVLGTRGSVIHTFIGQIERGGPVTVTDKQVTRFFMTVAEAVQLVLQAAVVGESGSALVLDMGVPVRIEHLAQQLISASGRDIAIDYPGLRPGEKLHEVLFAENENASPTSHPLISGVPVAPVAIQDIPDPRELHRPEQFMTTMTHVCGTMSAPLTLGA
ncbi:polysaccharide biosynthesis protein [Brachybacterium endophyticum]|uniref:Polysaccharide biosynthesis protein n=1 Tax=Brachybacterium endophyticum TaxID=2182385 RepID=A0A2U2RJV3_9MICO|nr:nucleoside-diphosphate sugar epimerase/dehydratase [Brachybacterium endophyticum]PWH06140.1 polysaccharide biosynthesis protein [Brachybacterium endophyticum]